MNRSFSIVLLVTMMMAAAGGLVRADSRLERPLQMQLDLSGVSVGYHFSERVYVGITYQGAVTETNMQFPYDTDNPTTRIYDQNRLQDATFGFGTRGSLELRFSPWKTGFYLALGVLSVDRDRQSLVYEATPRVVGNHAYQDAGLTLELRSKPYIGPAAGFGVNHVFESGLSLTAGFISGLKAEDRPDVEVSSFGSTPVTKADLELFRRQAEHDYLGYPPIGMFHLAIGYNF